MGKAKIDMEMNVCTGIPNYYDAQHAGVLIVTELADEDLLKRRLGMRKICDAIRKWKKGGDD